MNKNKKKILYKPNTAIFSRKNKSRLKLFFIKVSTISNRHRVLYNQSNLYKYFESFLIKVVQEKTYLEKFMNKYKNI